ncbi:hypothetical protein [Kocuria sp.]|uniref:hypothetical protein n=1 Tax=Kocuria sp. TaxID=1871328 RepID=UPI0026DEAFB6|nr:hypothetical protein [Kocuria sp.]MDO5618633.1 hypothetical protein [Kocuria sp.]
MTARALRLTRGWAAAFVATTFAVLAHVAAGGAWPHPMLFALCTALSAPVCMILAGRKIPSIARERGEVRPESSARTSMFCTGRLANRAKLATSGNLTTSGTPANIGSLATFKSLAGLSLAVAGSQTLFHILLSLSGGYVVAADHTGHAAHAGQAVTSGGPELVLVPAGAATTSGSQAGHAGHTMHLGDSASAMSMGDPAAASAALLGGHAMLVMHVVAAVVAIVVLRHGEAGLLRTLATLLVRAVRLAVAVIMPWVSVRPWQPGFTEPLPARILVWARGALQYRGPPRALALA